MKKYIIYAAILYTAYYFGNKQESQSSQNEHLQVGKSDTSSVIASQKHLLTLPDTTYLGSVQVKYNTVKMFY